MRCDICELRCTINEGGVGKCGMYTNRGGTVTERFPESYLFVFPISIETQPMLHFYPNHKFLQIGSIGCNFKCEGCVSEVFVTHLDVFLKSFKKYSARQLVEKAKENGCIGISFGINEPTMHFFSLIKLAREAKKEGLLFGISTNLYYTEVALQDLIQYLDFVNIGVKGFSSNTYQDICKVRTSKIVFRNISILFRHKIHFEVSIPYFNGKEDEIINVARFLSRLSRQIPLQVMRFIPFGEASASQEPSINKSEKLVERLKIYLNYVYLFNSPGTEYLDTVENEGFIKREFYGPMGAHVVEYEPPLKHITGDICKRDYQEKGFFGGYRITRAMEMVIGILNIIGVHDRYRIASVISQILKDDSFMDDFHEIQDGDSAGLEDFFEIVDRLSKLTNGADPSKFIVFYKRILKTVKQKRDLIKKRLKSYYVMGTPIFALNRNRFENKLAHYAGLNVICLEKEGKPGINISHDKLLSYNPDIVFISGFLSCTLEDFYKYCMKNNLNLKAVSSGKVYKLPLGWDFGSPYWIFGLMFIANKAYPNIYQFDIRREYKAFENRGRFKKNKSFYESIK